MEAVDPNSPISTDQFDVLFVVQPSSLNPQQLINLVDAVKAGVPTAIFEDPFPFAYQGIPGTGEPKQAQNNPMLGGGAPPEPKGDMQALWKLLGLDIPIQSSFSGINPDVVWQRYNPHPKLEYMANATSEWLFVLEGSGENEGYLSTASQITDGLRELMFLYAGAVRPEDKRDDLKVTELVKTRENSGRIGFSDLQTQMSGGNVSATQLQVLEGPPTGQQTIAVYIEGVNQQKAADGKEAAGEKTADKQTADKEATKEKDAAEATADASQSRPIKAVYVADVDFVHPFFSENRKNPEQFEELDLRVQNITFVLNIVDVLAGEKNYPTIRSHEPQHITLSLFEDQAEVYRLEESERQKSYQENFNKALQEAEEENQKSVAKFREKAEKLQREGTQSVSKQQELIGMMQQLQVQTAAMERKLAIRREKMESERDAQIQDSRRAAEAKVLELQNRYKMLAIFLPPIPPLIVGAGVFVTRRVREREGISKSRLK